MPMTRLLVISVLTTLLTACDGNQSTTPTAASLAGQAAPAAAKVTQSRLNNADKEPGQWMTYGGTYNEQRFSGLKQITADNIKELGLDWFADFDTNRGQESTPLMVDGVIYVTQAWSKVNAYDAKTGAVLWQYDPKVSGEFGARGCCDVVNRGVAVWNGKVYVGVYDGRLVALDAATGKEVWSAVTTDQSKFYTITGAPRVANGKVFIGNGGAEYIYRGYVSAYDAETGKQVWRFYTVPGNPADGFESKAMAMAAKTWSGKWWEKGGGGSTWDALTYDPKTNLLLMGVGNGAPWNSKVRSPDGGDNLFTVSIVAVDADTGEYKWHYQEIPAEEWDYDAVQQITVADIAINGATRHVAMQATKSGYYYMIDATTGQLLVANNFVPVNWTTGYDLATGRPVINDKARYTLAEGPRIAQPGPVGAHSWHSMAFSPNTGYLYIPARESSIAYTVMPKGSPGNFNLNVNFTGGDKAYDEPGNKIPRGGDTRILAWDPVQAKAVWSVTTAGSAVGMQVTASNVLFSGNGAKRELQAFKADTGEQIWSYPVQAGIAAGSMSYEIDGEQYLAQVVGGGGPGGYYAPTYARLLVFKLGGKAQLPPNAEYTQAPFATPAQTASVDEVAKGGTLYGGACAICHGDGGASRGMFPDLRRSPLLQSQEAFDQVVLGGIRKDKGMTSFEGKLSAADTALVRAYMVDRATAAKNAPAFAPPGQ